MQGLQFSPTTLPPFQRHRFTKTQPNPVRANPRNKRHYIAAAITIPDSLSVPRSQPPLVVDPESLQYPPGYVGAVPIRPEPDGDDDALNHLTSILTSRVYDVAVESPLELAPRLSERVKNNIYLKREDTQYVFSFKLRGAHNMMANLSKEELARGVICASAGNHAQGVALSAGKLKCRALIIMPIPTPDIKYQAVERLGAEVRRYGDTFDDAQAYARKLAEEEGYIFVPPFDNTDVIMGQGTVGMEIVRQMQDPIHAIFVPVGGGGLLAGVAAFVKRVSPEVKVIGVEPTKSNSMALSFHHDQRVILSSVGGFADGVAVKEVGAENFRISRELVDGIVLVDEDAMSAAIKDMFEDTRSILEPSGALSIAGAKAYCKFYNLSGKNVVAVTSGANMNFDKLREIAERANIGRKQEAILATQLPEVPGSFKQFCELVGKINITEFKYRYNSSEKAVVLYSVGVETDSELQALQERMESSKFKTKNLTESNLVKDHLRYLMGGRSNLENEVLFSFILPERPGALMKLLDSFSPRWNISLFHYRGQGDIGANILVGIQVPQNEMAELLDSANKLGFGYTVMNSYSQENVMDTCSNEKVKNNDDVFDLLMH